MISNIDRVLERGEKIELLVDKTDKLNHQAFKFEKLVSEFLAYVRPHDHCVDFVLQCCCLQSKALKNTMLCKKIKTYILIFVVLGVSYVIQRYYVLIELYY